MEKKNNGSDASLWNIFLLILLARKSESHSYPVVSMEKNFFMKRSCLPLKFRLYWSYMTPYFQVERIAVSCFFFMKASLMKVAWWIKWSMFLLFFWHPVWSLVIWPFDSTCHVRLLLIINSIVLQRQLINALSR